jgi:hypothetical protein
LIKINSIFALISSPYFQRASGFIDRMTISKIIIIMFLFFIPVDMVNGVLIRNGIIGISLPYKFLVLGLIIYHLIKHCRVLHVLVLPFIIVIYMLFNSINSPLEPIFPLHMVKYLSGVIFYLFFAFLVKNKREDDLFLIAKYAFIFLSINSLIGALGFGYPMYTVNEEVTIGSRGLIYAGNELGPALAASGSVLMIKYLSDDKYGLFFIVAISMLFSASVLTSKLSILGTLLLLFIFLFIKSYKSIENFKISKKDFNFAVLMYFFLPIATTFSIYYALYESNLFDRLNHYYHKTDFLTFILSGRNHRVEDGLNTMTESYSAGEYIIGSLRFYNSTEIDFFDFLFQYGIIGVLLTYGLVAFFLIYTLFLRGNEYTTYLTFSILLLVAMSLTAGHIFNSGTSSFVFAILFALINSQKKTNNENHNYGELKL